MCGGALGPREGATATAGGIAGRRHGAGPRWSTRPGGAHGVRRCAGASNDTEVGNAPRPRVKANVRHAEPGELRRPGRGVLRDAGGAWLAREAA